MVTDSHDARSGRHSKGHVPLADVHPQVEFDGLPRSDRVVGMIEAECRELGTQVPRIERCRVSLHAQQTASGQVCSYALRIEVTAPGKRVLVEQPCSARETRHMESLVSKAFDALRRRLQSCGDGR